MSRLPTPGGDDGSWGNVLNDFLSQLHSADGTLKPGIVPKASLASGVQSSLDKADAAATPALIDSKVAAQASTDSATYVAKPSGGSDGQFLTKSGSSVVWGSAAASGTAVNVKTANGATGDGTTNDTTAIQAAINGLPAAGGIIYIPRGTYMVDTLYINKSNVTVRGDGIGQTILKHRTGTAVDSRVLAFNSTGPTNTATAGSYYSNAAVMDLTIDNNNASVTSGNTSSSVQGSLFFGLIKNGTVRDVYIKDPREAGLNLVGCMYFDVQNVTIDGMLGQNQVNSINIVGDAFSGNPGYTVNQTPSTSIRVRSCRVIGNWATSSDSAAGGGICICVQGSTDISVTDCVIDLTGEPAARGRNGAGIIFEGGGPSGALLLGKNYIAANNKIMYCAKAIAALDTSGATVTTGILDGCAITGNEINDTIDGIVVNGRNATVTGNSVKAQTCIVVGANKTSIESNITISGNTLLPSQGAGIVGNKPSSGGSVEGLSITGNVIDGSSNTDASIGYGIVFFGSVHDFVISGNVIQNTLAAGIYLSANSSTVRPETGRILGNNLLNVCAGSGLSYPKWYGVVSSGSVDVLVALNHITGGSGLSKHIASENGLPMTIFGNTTASAGTVTDNNNSSNRLGGTVSGSRGGNAALASLLTGMASAQFITNSSSA